MKQLFLKSRNHGQGLEVPKRAHVYKNFSKGQLRINKSEKKRTFQLKMRKLASKISIQVLN